MKSLKILMIWKLDNQMLHKKLKQFKYFFICYIKYKMSIFDTLFIKRFCLPANVDVSSYEIGNSKISSCLCGNYNHAACILQGKFYIEKG